jgi:hypothetical protein
MDRRTFIGSLALATLVGPRAVSAQPARKLYRIGFLAGSSREVSRGLRRVVGHKPIGRGCPSRKPVVLDIVDFVLP